MADRTPESAARLTCEARAPWATDEGGFTVRDTCRRDQHDGPHEDSKGRTWTEAPALSAQQEQALRAAVKGLGDYFGRHEVRTVTVPVFDQYDSPYQPQCSCGSSLPSPTSKCPQEKVASDPLAALGVPDA